MIAFGLDVLLADRGSLEGRRYGLLSHQASVSARHELAHLALARGGFPPTLLFAPEHGFYGVEQDMVAAREQFDPWTGTPIQSLYGDDAQTLRPRAACFEGLDLLVIDLQDVGSRYYTYAATAVWAAEVAIECGCEVWLLDRPNPLGGVEVEGNLPEPGFESFVSAFCTPVRHGLTLGELLRLEGRRRGWAPEALMTFEMSGWRREAQWPELGRNWIAPSPNMPDHRTALVYPGGCLIEGTELSEGRGTTRPFLLLGDPSLAPLELCAALRATDLEGVEFIPSLFRPQFQKHAGEICGGVEVVVTDPVRFAPTRFGVRFLEVATSLMGSEFRWRAEAYEFVSEIPAIDLLAGTARLRQALTPPDDSEEPRLELDDWLAEWPRDEQRFREESAEIWLYPPSPSSRGRA